MTDPRPDLRVVELPDPFDPEQFRLDQSFLASAGVKKLLTTIPVRKPNKQDFIRTHPDEAYRLPVAIIELQEERETYLLCPPVARQLPGEFVMALLVTAVNRQGVLFLWPIKLPGADGKQSEWHRSAGEAAERAQKRWIRVTANLSLGAYETIEAAATIPDPEWPTTTFRELLEIAFRDRVITDSTHPVVKRLFGLA
jgi:hypothetical protein